ncbi:MAG: hypothetical protein NTU60_06155 [Candidatus Aminicenantes bacterium]|nr:hypothetical protein [Candidatus Aminicenantes bacterium]
MIFDLAPAIDLLCLYHKDGVFSTAENCHGAPRFQSDLPEPPGKYRETPGVGKVFSIGPRVRPEI